MLKYRVDIQSVKSKFPIFKSNPDLVYLDSASTAQKPADVISAIVDFYQNHNANIHRGIYPLSERATELYESARENIAKFINASPEEIIFTGGTTGGLNGLALSLQRSNIFSKKGKQGFVTPSEKGGIKILLSEIEHHSNILPWRIFSNALIDYAPADKETLNIDLAAIDLSQYDIISLSHVSNVTGGVVDVKYINSKRKRDSILILDSAQAIAHQKVDVKNLNVDFMVFSGHKLYGPTGIGVLYGKRELLERLEPYYTGGGMIESVEKDSASWAKVPHRFEAGTPPIAEAIGLSSAVSFVSEMGFEAIKEHESFLTSLLLERLKEIQGIEVYHAMGGLGVVSFSIKDIHPHDIAGFLSERNICVRAGHHCTQILHKNVLDIPGSVRVSLGIYNDNDDIKELINALKVLPY